MTRTLVSASAGSGKTTTLVSRITEVLQYIKPSSVVAITFTNAAVREIRERVLSSFKGTSKEEEVKEVNISTIHSFFGNILKEQSLLLKINPDFKIMDPVESGIIFSDICKDIIMSKVEDDEFFKLFQQFDFNKILGILIKIESKYDLIRDNITELSYSMLYNRERDAEHTLLEKTLGDYFSSEVLDVIINYVCKSSENKLEKERRYYLPLVIALKQHVGSPFRIKDRENFLSILSIFNEIDTGRNKVSRLTSKSGWDDPEMIEVLIAAINRLIDTNRILNRHKLGDESIARLAAGYESLIISLFNDVHYKFTDFKKHNETMDYNDLELITYDLFREHKWLKEYYRKKYEFILVDEFQDTNVLQRDILFDIGKELFLVGDSKQSIYRFRNADVSVFMQTERDLIEGNALFLHNNYRSYGRILNCVNETFNELFENWLEKKENYDPDYSDMIPNKDPNKGLVKYFYSHSIEEEALIISDIIKNGIREGKKPGDFAILFRLKRNIPIFEKTLLNSGISSVVYGSTDREVIICRLVDLFTALMNPFDDYAMLNLCKLPVFFIDDLVLYGLRDKNISLYSSIKNYDCELNKNNFSVENINSIRLLIKFISIFTGLSFTGNFLEFVCMVLKETDFIQSVFFMYPGLERGLLKKILEIAQLVESRGQGIEYFVRILKDMNFETHECGTDSEVKLMTVHASKGLQFKVVFLPCLHHFNIIKDDLVIGHNGVFSVKLRDDGSNTRFNTALYEQVKEYEKGAEISESKRLLYVAMTRAEEELYFLGNFKKDIKLENAKQSLRWIDWLSAIHTDKIEEYANLRENLQSSSNPPKRIVNRILKDKMKLQENSVFGRRFSVSMLRDFVFCPFLMLRRFVDSELSKDSSGDETKGKIKMGTTIHSILESPFDTSHINKVYSNIGTYVKSHIEPVINDFINSEIAKKIFSTEKYFTEYPFICKIDNNVIAGRIDRINVCDNSIWIIDYKTGMEDISYESYKIQMLCYVYYASRIFPDKDIKASIVDIIECNEYEIDTKMSEKLLKELLFKVNSFLSHSFDTCVVHNCEKCNYSKSCSYKGLGRQ